MIADETKEDLAKAVEFCGSSMEGKAMLLFMETRS